MTGKAVSYISGFYVFHPYVLGRYTLNDCYFYKVYEKPDMLVLGDHSERFVVEWPDYQAGKIFYPTVPRRLMDGDGRKEIIVHLITTLKEEKIKFAIDFKNWVVLSATVN